MTKHRVIYRLGNVNQGFSSWIRDFTTYKEAMDDIKQAKEAYAARNTAPNYSLEAEYHGEVDL